jgi:hypothetical protein
LSAWRETTDGTELVRVKIYFRVVPCCFGMAKAWHLGDVDDCDLIRVAELVPLPCPVWYVMSLSGGPAGGRQVLAWLRATARDGVCEGFIWRTNLYGLARLAERWGGLHGHRDNSDERERFWIPARALVSPQADKSGVRAGTD